MKRVLEPEVMNDEEQAAAYALADFSSSNQMFVDGFLADCDSGCARILDLGCGPADIPIRIVRARPSLHVTAVDASDAMLRLAAEAVQQAGFSQQIALVKGRLPGLSLGDAKFDAIVSKDLLHHLPDPLVFWEEAKRLARGRARVYVMDLFRPQSKQDARDIVESVSAGEPEILKSDFYNSLLAAFTADEIEEQLRRANLDLEVRTVSERHLLIKGVLE
ncbi:MAG: class I SAM-dependent methyltransferase [Sedimentisphaerales bacterium]|nr:class I SAM-dependent methyltransferase [Sedimentisphaerales bacterium]